MRSINKNSNHIKSDLSASIMSISLRTLHVYSVASIQSFRRTLCTSIWSIVMIRLENLGTLVKIVLNSSTFLYKRLMSLSVACFASSSGCLSSSSSSRYYLASYSLLITFSSIICSAGSSSIYMSLSRPDSL
jgi:hypothetical protein